MTFYTTKAAAESLFLTERRIRQLVRSGELKAARHGWAWLITEQALEAYRAKRSR